jgi:hypothetical protein
LVLISREVNDFKVAENRMLRRIFGTKKTEVIEGWRH